MLNSFFGDLCWKFHFPSGVRLETQLSKANTRLETLELSIIETTRPPSTEPISFCIQTSWGLRCPGTQPAYETLARVRCGVQQSRLLGLSEIRLWGLGSLDCKGLPFWTGSHLRLKALWFFQKSESFGQDLKVNQYQKGRVILPARLSLKIWPSPIKTVIR